MKRSRSLAVRIPEETWENLRREAMRKGLTTSKLVRAKIMLSTEFEGPILDCIDEYSKRLGLSRHEFVEAVVIDFMARISTTEAPAEGRSGHFLPMFAQTGRGLMKGVELFEHLISHYCDDNACPGNDRPTAARRPAEDTGGRTIDSPRSSGKSPSDRGTPHTDAERIARQRFDKELHDRIMDFYRNKHARQ
ncbi:MAG: hypothetical protein JSV33_08045 [bacterium]|nr:MAG: hypothetical protein JSV33_08045 [bacterium]